VHRKSSLSSTILVSLYHSTDDPRLTRNKQLTPFVSGEIPEHEKLPTDPLGKPYGRIDGMQYLKWWRDQNPDEYDWVVQGEAQAEAEAESLGLEEPTR